jgi:hypothetical protein
MLPVPDSHGRYYTVEIVDFWTNAFAYAGGVETGYKGGRFALVGPGWQGQLPADVERIDAPTRWVLIQPRIHVLGRDDLPAAKTVLDAITVEGLAKTTGGKAPTQSPYRYIEQLFADPKLPVSALDFKDPLQFWEILAEAMNDNPPPADQLSALVPLFQPLGIVPGKSWAPTQLDPVVCEAMTKAAKGLGTTLALLPGSIDLWKYWKAISVPMLVLRGEESDLLPADLAGQMERLNPLASVREFAGCGHAPPLLTADQIDPVVDFLCATG